MTNTHKLVVVGVVVAMLLSAVAFLKAGPGPKGPTGDKGDTVLGSVASPDIASPYFTYGSFRQWGYRYASRTSSTTLCSSLSPASTSTLDFGSIQINTATATALQVEFGKSTLMDATTTRIGDLVAVAANQKLTLVASTTAGTHGQGTTIFAPNTYFNVKIGSAVGGPTNLIGGSCTANFVEN